MTDTQRLEAKSPAWKGRLGVLFAALWGVAGPLILPPPAREPLIDADTYAGQLFGYGMVFGLFAAAVAHLLVLRGQPRKVKVLAYVLGALAGGTGWAVLNT